MLILLVFIPLFNFLSMFFFEFFIGKRRACHLIAHSYVLMVFLGIWSFYKVCIIGDFQYLTLGTWINCGLFVVNWGFIFDSLSVSMLLMVSLVSGSVHYYSIGYMESDPYLVRFLSYLSLFTFFMFILVSADNFVQLFLGWEGIGLCSYLLISFWNTRIQANKAALKALVMNRIGDFGFLCGLLVIFYHFRSVDFSVIFALAPYFKTLSTGSLEIACLLLFLGSMGKSAQLGLHTWLPDAMEGPTPVSALIHAATLVTAGVFLIIRCSPIFEFAPNTLFVILLIGGLTSFFAATVAITQNDIKKVIAYSTCSQLGYMVFICGLSAYDISMFHLVNHAFFKALLFLSAGSVIHALSGEQDMRKFGGLVNLIPYTYSMFLIGTIALAGLPFLSGFYSKDLILEVAYSRYTINGLFVYWLGTLSAGLTAFYSFRVIYLTFWSGFSGYKFYIQNVHELPRTMGFALFVLSIGSIFSGYFLKEAFVGAGSNFWGNSIFILERSLDYEFINWLPKSLPLIFSILGCFWAFYINKFWDYKYKAIMTSNTNGITYPQNLVSIYGFLTNKWYFDYLYNHYVGYFILKYSYVIFYKYVDEGFIKIFGPKGVSYIIYNMGLIISKKQSGYIYHTASFIVLSFFLLFYVSLIW